MRRGVGVSRHVKNRKQKEAFKEKGKELTEVKLGHMQEQLSVFKAQLETFAMKHKKQINKDPAFRRQFQTMCTKIGVDPLASSKGFWADILGIGNFYFELAVQIVHVCLATRETNGGLMDMTDMVAYLGRIRARQQHSNNNNSSDNNNTVVSTDDVKRAVGKLSVLGNGIRLLQVGMRKVVVSVPTELSHDHTSLMQAGQTTGYVSVEGVVKSLRWDPERIHRALEFLMREGMVWVDDQGNAEQDGATRLYWFPSTFVNLHS